MTTTAVAKNAIAASISTASTAKPAIQALHQQGPGTAAKSDAPTDTRQSQAWSEVPRTQITKPKDDDASSTSSAGEHRTAIPPVKQPSIKGRPGQLPPITRPSKPAAQKVNFAEGDL